MARPISLPKDLSDLSNVLLLPTREKALSYTLNMAANRNPTVNNAMANRLKY